METEAVARAAEPTLAAMARYPFLPQAAAYVGAHGPALEELLGDRFYAGVRARGRDRLVAAVERAELPPVLLDESSPPRELLEELLGYAYARILVSVTKDAYVARRHALAEAVRVRAFLDKEEDPDVVGACAAAAGLAFVPQGAEFCGHFTEYLRMAVHLKDLEWKLVRQRLRRGEVTVTRTTLARLVQEALRRRIEGELPRPLPDEAASLAAADAAPVREAARLRQEQFRAEAVGEVDLALMPPCMQHLLGMLQAGENVPHSGRFALTSFLHTIGMGPEDIMKLFATAPDFREDLTRYQVEHITGVTGDKAYTPPGCQAMQTFGICYNADDTCRSRKKDGTPRVTHPLNYYRFKLWLKSRPARGA